MMMKETSETAKKDGIIQIRRRTMKRYIRPSPRRTASLRMATAARSGDRAAAASGCAGRLLREVVLLGIAGGRAGIGPGSPGHRHVMEVVLYRGEEIAGGAEAEDVELVGRDVEQLGEQLLLLLLVRRALDLAIEIHLLLHRRRGLLPALAAAGIPVAPGNGEEGLVPEREVEGGLEHRIGGAAAALEHRRVLVVLVLAVVEQRAVDGLGLGVDADLLPVLGDELDRIEPVAERRDHHDGKAD